MTIHYHICVNYVGECDGTIYPGEVKTCTVKNYIYCGDFTNFRSDIPITAGTTSQQSNNTLTTTPTNATSQQSNNTLTTTPSTATSQQSNNTLTTIPTTAPIQSSSNVEEVLKQVI